MSAPAYDEASHAALTTKAQFRPSVERTGGPLKYNSRAVRKFREIRLCQVTKPEAMLEPVRKGLAERQAGE